MRKHIFFSLVFIAAAFFTACTSNNSGQAESSLTPDSTAVNDTIQPVAVTEPVQFDTDDPAIWYNCANPAQSLVVGTDKEDQGGLYVFDLDGKIVRKHTGMQRPNNVDVLQNILVGGRKMDVAITSERYAHKVRIFSMPDLVPVDSGGFEAFIGEEGVEFRDLMGIAGYRDPATGKGYALVGRKNGPTDSTYIWQYELVASGDAITGKLVRTFGAFSGQKEIEALCVDDELGYVYMSDERAGIRKYFAHPDSSNRELAFFGQGAYLEDNEGISIYRTSATDGYILVSDQSAGKFRVYNREAEVFPSGAHQHREIGVIQVAAVESDGSEIIANTLGGKFPGGLFVAMSDDQTFHYYAVENLFKSTGLSLVNSANEENPCAEQEVN